MRLRRAHIVVLLAVLAMLCGCGRRSRVIPADKLSHIYQDIYLADQWVRDNPSGRKMADTTLLFDPILRRYGYTFEDYDRTVHYYLDHPEEYSKILDRASERLRKEGERMQQAVDEQTAREIELSGYRKGYVRHKFSPDSLNWTGMSYWPVPTEQPDWTPSPQVGVDEPEAPTDSLRVLDRHHPVLKEPENGKLEIKQLR